MRLEASPGRALGCASDFEVGSFLGDIEVDGAGSLTRLRTTPDPDAKAARADLITAIRGGKHVELAVTARTFRQRKSMPNRRFLRLAGDLASSVKTFKGMPFLVDHDTHTQSSRKGTILSSTLIEGSGSLIEFEMSLNVVKPDAVISVLDGTIDAFSIGWFALGPVICSVHKTDVRGRNSCSCWPGGEVEVDGKPQIVEYEFTAWEGKEVSGVNVPAVKNTSITDIRAALAAELSIPTTRSNEHQERNQMAFHRLAAALGLAVLSDGDEPAAVAAAEGLSRRALAAEQERDSARTQLAEAKASLVQAEAALGALTATSIKVQVDAKIAKAYQDGKLGYGRDEHGNPIPSKREARLRRLAAASEKLGGGLAALDAELEELEVSIPVRQRLASADAAAPARTELTEPALDDQNPYLINVANQLGLKVEDMVAFGNNHVPQVEG